MALEYHTHKKIPPSSLGNTILTSTNTERNHPSPHPTESTPTESAAKSIQEGMGKEKNESAIVTSRGADVNKERDALSTREGDVASLNKPTVSAIGDILFIILYT